jgi:Fe-S cluster biosynthesis and repair protein YggX
LTARVHGYSVHGYSLFNEAIVLWENLTMPIVTCRRCGELKPGIEEAPLPGEWGQAVLDETCADCWHEWSQEQTRIINHLGLKPFKASDKKTLYRHLHEYLKLQGVAAPE